MSEKRSGVIGTQHYNSQAAQPGWPGQQGNAAGPHLPGRRRSRQRFLAGGGRSVRHRFRGPHPQDRHPPGPGHKLHEEAMAQLQGITLESTVIATRSARAIKKKIAAGELKAEDFPLLMHVYDIIVENKPVNIPWKAFETEFVG